MSGIITLAPVEIDGYALLMRKTLWFALAVLLAIIGIAVVARVRDEPVNLEPPVAPALARADPAVRQTVRARIDALRNNVQSAPLWADLGMVYHANCFYREAVVCYEQASALMDQMPQWHYLRALAKAEQSHFEDAIQDLDRLLELDAEHASAHWRRGLWLLELARIDEAEQSFRNALNHNPDSRAAQLGLALVALQRQDPQQAVERLQARIVVHPEDAYARFLLGTAYRQVGQHDAADIELRLAGGADPHWTDPVAAGLLDLRAGFAFAMKTAIADLNSGDPSSATRTLERLRRDNPENVTILVNLGSAYLAAGRVNQSIETLGFAERIEPDNFAVHLNLAVAFERRNDLAGALSRATRAATLNPHIASTHKTLGIILYKAGRPHEAIASFEQAFACDARNADVLFWIGLIKLESFQSSSAEESLELAVRLDPTLYEAYVALGRARIALGRLDGAEMALSRAQQLQPAGSDSLNQAMAELRSRRSSP